MLGSPGTPVLHIPNKDERTIKQARARLDKLIGFTFEDYQFSGEMDRRRMERAADVIVGKESYIKQLEAEGGCELLAEGHLAMVSEYGLDYGTTPIDLQERRGERAYHAAWVIQQLKGDLKDARQGGALFAAMCEANEKLIVELQAALHKAADE